MKPSHKLILAACLAASLAATLSGCASTTLEQQIAVKEPGSWDFSVKNAAGSTEYIRIYDSPGKVGYFKYEYGQKHPCNQGFQKMTKETAPGLVQYVTDIEAKAFACNLNKRYIFRTNSQGHPDEGWTTNPIKDGEKRVFSELSDTVKWWDANKIKPTFTLVR